MNKGIINAKINLELYNKIKDLIENTKAKVAQTINSNITLLYWNIGKEISENILFKERADYGKQIVATLSHKLMNEYGKGFSRPALSRMCLFYKLFPEFNIVAALSHKLSWSHIVEIISIKKVVEREFYIQMCIIENWSIRELRKKIDSMLYERTAISKKPEKLAKLELSALSKTGELSPDLVFRNPYVLDFLNLKDTYQEKDLEKAILNEIEKFVLELGKGFSFVERQKRMIIDNEDFYLDLLFYHRKLKRLVAIDLKLGRFKASYKGQMEMYLNWLEKNEMEQGEEKPIGLILCAEGKNEQIELLQLEKSNIRVAEYITQILPREWLHKKLQKFYFESKELMKIRKEK